MTWEGNDMISKKVGIVESIKSSDDNLEDIRVNVNGQIQRAYNYPKMTGKVAVGDEVILNTTAVELSLGTGGYHFVISNLNNMESDLDSAGHIMKLRYTPYQIVVDSVEDHESKYHDVINNFESLDNLPVVVGTLHSMLTPFVASYKRNNPDKKIAYIMTDGAALPLYLSMNVKNLKQNGLIDSTITIGNAFGGDYECITVFDKIVNVDVNIPITIYESQKLNKIKEQIKENKLDEKHNIIFIENNKCKEDLEHFGLKVKSMGRNYDEDSEFFDSASSAAYYLMEVCHD